MRNTIKDLDRLSEYYTDKKLFIYAVNKLARQDYFIKELETKMSQVQKDPEIIKVVIDRLITNGYISDERKLSSLYARYKTKESFQKIASRALFKGCGKETIEDFKSQLEQNTENTQEEDQNEIIKNIMDKKLKSNFYLLKDPKVKSKIIAYVMSKGFSYEKIKKCIQAVSEEIEC